MWIGLLIVFLIMFNLFLLLLLIILREERDYISEPLLACCIKKSVLVTASISDILRQLLLVRSVNNRIGRLYLNLLFFYILLSWPITDAKSCYLGLVSFFLSPFMSFSNIVHFLLLIICCILLSWTVFTLILWYFNVALLSCF